MSLPSASLFIIISAPYATSVPLYLKSEDMAKMVPCALVGSRLDYANSVPFGATQKNISKLQKAQNLLALFSSILQSTYSPPAAPLAPD